MRPFNHTKGLSTVTVSRFNDILIAGNNFSQLKDKTLTLADISDYPFICLRHGMQLREFIDDVFDENGLTVTPDIEADGADILVSMICHNLGIGFVPQGMAELAISLNKASVFISTTSCRSVKFAWLPTRTTLRPLLRESFAKS